MDADTIIEKNEPIQIDTIMDTTFGSDIFKSGDYKLNVDISKELQEFINNINAIGGEINKIFIESSTDKEPIAIGNEKLAELRGLSIASVLSDLGIGMESIDVKHLPEQGPDIYTKTMSSEEREQARKLTEKYRYVKISFDVTVHSKQRDTSKVVDIIKTIEVTLVRPKSKDYIPTIKTRKTFTCKKIKTKKGEYDCPKF